MAPMAPIPDRPMFRGERVWLRAIEPADVTEVPVGDAELAHFAGFKRPFSRAEQERFATKISAQGDAGYQFAICELGSDRAIGSVGLRDIDRLDGAAEVAIFLADRATWGRGLGTDAMLALLDFAFGELRLERVWLRVFDYNPRAIRSYEKAGFRTDAVLRHDRFHRGRHHDTHLMAILRAEWEAHDHIRSWDR
jgi:RimJ/RimL family protein N-acetyltransferase